MALKTNKNNMGGNMPADTPHRVVNTGFNKDNDTSSLTGDHGAKSLNTSRIPKNGGITKKAPGSK